MGNDDTPPSFDNRDNDFNEFIRKIQKLMEEFMQSANIKEINEDFEKIFGDMGGGPPVWGFSFNSGGPDGKPFFQPFGNFMKQFGFGSSKIIEKEDLTKSREPIVDVIKEVDKVLIIAEMPGVNKKNIDIHSTETVLKIKAKSEKRHYRKSLSLPCPIIPETAKAAFRNGVLEISFDIK